MAAIVYFWRWLEVEKYGRVIERDIDTAIALIIMWCLYIIFTQNIYEILLKNERS